jgi:uncharacterized protein YdhG (YjbR/CyaY superfamily)
MKIEYLYSKLASPARRALQTLGVPEIEDLSRYEKEMVSELHGIGPNALKVIEQEMSLLNVSFRKKAETIQGTKEGDVASVDRYISGFPQHIQEKLQEIRSIIRSAAPAASEKISYGIPTFYLQGNLVHFAGYTKHIGFYPGAAAITIFKEELKGYKSAKGSVQFPIEQPLPAELIKQIVRLRVEENVGKTA